MTTNKCRITFGILAVVALLIPTAAHARTTLFFDAPPEVRPAVEVPILLRAHVEEPINAIQLTVRYDPSRLIIGDVNDQDSAIRHWLEFPQHSTSGSLAFEGIIPGGVGPGLTDTVTIARLTVQFLRPGPASLSIESATVYSHQSEPRKDEVAVRSATIMVRANAPEISVAPVSAEGFLDADVRLVREPTLNDGAWSLVFDVRTMQGRAPIRVRERFLGLGGVWENAVSPYRLSDQQLLSILEVGLASGSDTQNIRMIVPGRLQSVIALLLVAAIVMVLRWLPRHRG